jgi:NhaP-type Na+/H+ or K+/H+ antiporter
MTDYVPGACNIGPAEIRRRRRGGIASGAMVLAGLAAAVALDLPRPFRLVLAVPAGLSALGLLQAGSRFCAAFGLLGLVNVSDDLRARRAVADPAARLQDRRRSVRLLSWSGAIGVAVAAASLLLPAGGGRAPRRPR